MAGKSDDEKSRLADAITRDVTDILGYGDDAVSILFDEVAPSDWAEGVHKPDILSRWARRDAARPAHRS